MTDNTQIYAMRYLAFHERLTDIPEARNMECESSLTSFHPPHVEFAPTKTHLCISYKYTTSGMLLMNLFLGF